MESHQVLQALYQKVSPKVLAAQLGTSVSTLHKWSEPGESHRTNPLEHLLELTRAAEDLALVHWLCQKCGGTFVPNPKPAALPAAALLTAHSRVVQEFGEVMAEIGAAVEDSQVSASEAKRIRQRWEELKSVSEGFVRCCEVGDFQALKAAVAAQASDQAPVQLATGAFSPQPSGGHSPAAGAKLFRSNRA